MSGFSVRAVFAGLEEVPAAVWLWTGLAALVSQVPAVAVGLGAQLGAPAWLNPLAEGLVFALTLVLPTLATARWQQPLIPMGTALRQALPWAVGLSFVCILLSTGYGLLPGSAPSGWIGSLLRGLVGGLALYLALRASLWFNLLALPGTAGLSALRESFGLTGPVGFRLFLFWVLFTILVFLLSIPVTMLLDALTGRLVDPSLLLVGVIGLMSSVMATITAIALAVIHRQLTVLNQSVTA